MAGICSRTVWVCVNDVSSSHTSIFRDKYEWTTRTVELLVSEDPMTELWAAEVCAPVFLGMKSNRWTFATMADSAKPPITNTHYDKARAHNRLGISAIVD